MTSGVTVRRIRLHEWREVRELRIEAVGDAAAAIAFLTTLEQERERDDAFWRDRAAGGALGENAAQFIAQDGEHWVGTATVLLRSAAARDHLGHVLSEPRADIVGVYVAPTHRGRGVLDELFAHAEEWASERGVVGLTLSVHRDNARAQAAYRKAGFAPTGVAFTSTIGPEIEMRRNGRVLG